MENPNWASTVEALDELGKTLICTVCSKLLKEPCSLGVCDHLYCKCCIVNHLGNTCPECGSPAWVKDLMPNRELTVVVQMYHRLQRLVKQCPNVQDGEKEVDEDSLLTTSNDITEKTGELEKREEQESSNIADSNLLLTKSDCGQTESVEDTEETMSEDTSSSNTSETDSELQPKNNKRAKYLLPWRKKASKKTRKHLSKRPRCPRDTAFLKENIGKKSKQLEISSFLTASDDYCPPFKKHSVSAEMRKKKIDNSNAEWEKMPLKDLPNNNGRRSKRTNKRSVSFSCMEPDLNTDGQAPDDELSSDHGDRDHLEMSDSSPDGSHFIVKNNNTRLRSRTTPDASPCETKSCGGRKRSSLEVDQSSSGRRRSSLEGDKMSCGRKQSLLEGDQPSCGRTRSSLEGDQTLPGSKQSLLERDQLSSGKKRSSLEADISSSGRKRSSLQADQSPGGRKWSSLETDQPSKRKQPSCQRVAPVDHLMKRNKKGETPLHIAAIKGDIQEVETLLQQGADANVRDYAGWRPLHEAANHGHATVVSLLLDHGALIDAPGFENDSPLHDALANNRLDVVRILVKNGANLLARNMFGAMPSGMATTKAMKNALKTKVLPSNERAGHSVEITVGKQVSSNNINDGFVFICTGLNNDQKKTMETCAKMLGAEISKDFNDDVTHVIASCAGAVCLRTLKYLQGIIASKWVISFDWVESCLREQKSVDEESFEVAGTMSSPSSPGPMRARINTANQYPPLFDGCHFYFHGNFTSPSKKDLGQLVKRGGGTLLLREPKMDDDIVQSSRRVPYHASLDSQQPNCCYYIINSPLQDALLVNTAKLCSVPLSWLMDCIAQFKILNTEAY